MALLFYSHLTVFLSFSAQNLAVAAAVVAAVAVAADVVAAAAVVVVVDVAAVAYVVSGMLPGSY